MADPGELSGGARDGSRGARAPARYCVARLYPLDWSVIVDRLTPGIIAIAVGAVFAVLLFVPFVAASYRLRGGMTVPRTLGWVALLV